MSESKNESKNESLEFTIVGAGYRHHEVKLKRDGVWRKLRSLPMFSIILLSVIILGCFMADALANHDPSKFYLSNLSQPPDSEFFFGTDSLGRDIYSIIWYGGRVSIFIGLLATCVITVIGVTYGCVSGMAGAFLDNAMMRAVGAADLFRDALGEGNGAYKENLALQDEYAKFAASYANILAVYMQKIKSAGIEIGTALMPMVTNVAGLAAGVAQGFAGLSDGMQSTIVAGGGVLALLGPVTNGLGKLMESAKNAPKTFSALATGLKSIPSLLKAISPTTLGIGAAALAVGGIVLVIVVTSTCLFRVQVLMTYKYRQWCIC